MGIKAKGMLTTIVVLLGCFAVFSQSSSWGQEAGEITLVNLTGTIDQIEKKDVKGGLAYMHISIGKKVLYFNVTKVKALGTTSLSEINIINSIFPPFLNIYGSSETLAPLLKPDIVGKVVTMEGNLNTVNHFMQVEKIIIGK